MFWLPTLPQPSLNFKSSKTCREVTIGKGAVIKNCVIFSGSKIASGAVLENVIIDKRAKVEKKLELKGTETSPLYIKEGDRV